MGAKVLVLVLGLTVALSWAMPALARAAVGPGPHVCHCEIRNGHSTCTCAKCFPERDGLSLSEDSLRGQCGDDEAVLRELTAAGLDSLPGGGAEIFEPRVRRKISHDKADADRYLSIHRLAHRLGIRSNVTMLYGHIETAEDRIDHMLRVRALQDETGGFQAFIPLAFHPDNNQMRKLPAPSATDTLRVHAVARLMLDNVPHIKAFWIATGVDVAQLALWYGANDLDGTVQEERIYHMAGSRTPEALSSADIRRLIEAAGRQPIERDTLYRELEPRTPHAAPAVVNAPSALLH